jgi:hypothetical protein
MAGQRPDPRSLQSILRFLHDGTMLVLPVGELPSLRWVESYRESVPQEYWDEYLHLHGARVKIAQGTGEDPAAWRLRWDAFEATLAALGKIREYAMVVGEGRIESIEPV